MAEPGPADGPAVTGAPDTAVRPAPGSVDGLILAGGRSVRMRTPAMPDVDKGLRDWRGQALVGHVRRYMRDQGVERIFISANRHIDAYAEFGQVLQDAAAWQHHGPLAGVLAGLQHAVSPWVFILPVDVLRWPAGLLARLAAVATPERPAYARTSDGPHPLCLVAHRALADGLQDFLSSGQRQVQAWLRHCRARAVDFPAADCLVNLNTPQDWNRWAHPADGVATGPEGAARLMAPGSLS